MCVVLIFAFFQADSNIKQHNKFMWEINTELSDSHDTKSSVSITCNACLHNKSHMEYLHIIVV